MRWEDNRESDNVEDRRDDSGGGGGMGFGGIHLGVGGVVLVLVGSWIFGVNPMAVLGLLAAAAMSRHRHRRRARPARRAARQRPAGALRVDHSRQHRRRMGRDIHASRPHLRAAASGAVSRCDTDRLRYGQSAMGPFYCPQDRKVYIDLGFYQTLRDQLGSPGDFAQAYVIAHEVGHHVQNLLGTTAKVDALRARENRVQANATSVRVELQADCYAPACGRFIRRRRSTGSRAAISLGAQCRIAHRRRRAAEKVPGPSDARTFTHGTSAQRVNWFKRGPRHRTGRGLRPPSAARRCDHASLILSGQLVMDVGGDLTCA